MIDGRVVLVDILAGRLLELLDDNGPPRELLSVDVPLGAVAPRLGGGWVAAAGNGLAVLGHGEARCLGRCGPAAEVRMNDGCTDVTGRFWAGVMRWDAGQGGGSLHRLDPDGTLTQVLDGLTVPNGPVLDATGTTMYVADSARAVIDRLDVDPVHGTLSGRRRFATVVAGSPDGMAVDAEGCLWSAVWGAGRVHRYAPDGGLRAVYTLPVSQPTSIALTGRELIVTTARYGLEQPSDIDGAVFTAACTIAPVPVPTAAPH